MPTRLGHAQGAEVKAEPVDELAAGLEKVLDAILTILTGSFDHNGDGLESGKEERNRKRQLAAISLCVR